ncbi:fasciclin-like arabinogalactan protein 6 [Tasmannia lanceolata]|uniref:fasciclin-like arabinogalactan protein 6 n=1 Tax=Tasmannia lanceolata TaxID=3420 RepID=UPI004063284D
MGSPSPQILLLLALTSSLFLTTPQVHAQSTLAPAPSASPLNLTAILEKGGQYNIFMRLLSTTQIDSQIINQLNNSNQGLTLFAPTDNAFNSLKPGTLNSLSPQQQVALILYHILPKYYSLQMFDTISNPERTQASGNDGGLYYLNFTTIPNTNQVNISTGIVTTQINNALYSQPPLAVYEVDKVLLPIDLFGTKPPSAAPSPPTTPGKSPPSPSSPSTGGQAASVNSPTSAGHVGRNVRGSIVLGIVLVFMGVAF